MTAADIIPIARRSSYILLADGDDLDVDAPASASPVIIDLLRRFKPEILELLRAERCAIVRYVADHFQSSPLGQCAHCGGGIRQHDPFVALFVGDDRADIHASCHPGSIADQEAKARVAHGIETPTLKDGHVDVA